GEELWQERARDADRGDRLDAVAKPGADRQRRGDEQRAERDRQREDVEREVPEVEREVDRSEPDPEERVPEARERAREPVATPCGREPDADPRGDEHAGAEATGRIAPENEEEHAEEEHDRAGVLEPDAADQILEPLRRRGGWHGRRRRRSFR